ncbi:MAG TPA: hypothetical protein VIY54_13600 [Steroidobacteraceae bacterium]
MFRLFRIWRFGRHDLQLLWFALRHRQRPAWLWPAALLLAWYALEPANFAIPFLGVVDDLVLVPALLHILLRWLPAEIRADFDGRSTSPAEARLRRGERTVIDGHAEPR